MWKELEQMFKDLGLGLAQLLTSQAAFSGPQLSHSCTSEVMSTRVFRKEGSTKETLGCWRLNLKYLTVR